MKSGIKIVLRQIRNIFLRMLFYTLRIFPIQKNKIFVSNFAGNSYGDNLKYIVEQLLKVDMHYDIIWLTKNHDDDKSLPNGVRAIHYKRIPIRSIYEQVTAKIWIDNVRKPNYVRKRRGQYYIQTWHGSYPLKRIEKDAVSILDHSYILDAQYDSKLIDVIISGNEFMTKLYQTAFWYSGRVENFGTPKYDILLIKPSKIVGKVYEAFDIDEGNKILLYVPTFRNVDSVNMLLDSYNNCIEALEDRFGSKWTVLVRLHPNMDRQIYKEIYNAKVIDATKYPDVQELMLASSVMVTDYSGLMFEFSLMGRPCFLLTKDWHDYTKSRGLYFSLDEIPFCVSETDEELCDNIRKFEMEKYSIQIASFFQRNKHYETGEASQRVAKLVEDIMIDGRERIL